MKNNMHLTLNKTSFDPIERLLISLTAFIDTLKHSQKTFQENLTFCRELRTNRKRFEKEMRTVISQFPSFDERRQADTEMAFFKALKKIEKIVPEIVNEIEDEKLFILFSFLLKREVSKTYNFLKRTQVKMAGQLYPDNSKKILKNPDLYKKLVDTWGDLAND